jgi:hypothetical protein
VITQSLGVTAPLVYQAHWSPLRKFVPRRPRASRHLSTPSPAMSDNPCSGRRRHAHRPQIARDSKQLRSHERTPRKKTQPAPHRDRPKPSSRRSRARTPPGNSSEQEAPKKHDSPRSRQANHVRYTRTYYPRPGTDRPDQFAARVENGAQLAFGTCLMPVIQTPAIPLHAQMQVALP